jgi:hypothetical protein
MADAAFQRQFGFLHAGGEFVFLAEAFCGDGDAVGHYVIEFADQSRSRARIVGELELFI